MIEQKNITEFFENVKHFLNDKLEFFVNYNISGGKSFRSILFMKTIEMFKGNELEENTLFNYSICIEIFHAILLVTDDIIDNSDMRRDKPSFWKLENIGLNCLFTSSTLFSVLNIFVKKENESKMDSNRKYEALRILNNTFLKTWMGQLQDTLKKTPRSIQELHRFIDIGFYESIVDSKTCEYTLRLPLYLGIILSAENLTDISKFIDNYFQSRLCFKIGFLMQIQDDYLNFYPQLSGKSGTDLNERKVTYFLCTYYHTLIQDDDKLRFLNYFSYGDDGPIKDIETAITEYIKLHYDIIERQNLDLILKDIENLCEDYRVVFMFILNLISGRKR